MTILDPSGVPYGSALTMEQRLARLEQRLGVAIPAPPADGYTIFSDISQSGGVKWAWPAGSLACKMYRVYDGATSAATSGWAGLSGLTTTAWDYHPGTAQADGANGRIYARVTGIYHVSASFAYASAFSGLKGFTIGVNGSIPAPNAQAIGIHHWDDGTTAAYGGTINADIALTAGQYVNIGFYNPAAVARILDWNYISLAMHLVRAA